MPATPGARLRAGDVAAVLLPPGPAWAALVARAWEAEAALLPVDDRLPRSAVEALLERARPTVVVDADGTRRTGRGRHAEPPLALVMATSGTTDEPRLVELGRDAVRAAVDASAAALGAGPADPWLSCLPLAHVGGLLVLYRAVLMGAPLTVHRRFDADALAAAAAAGDCAFTALVPTALSRLLDAAAVTGGGPAQRSLAALRGVLVGGGALPAEVAARARAARLRCIATYGQTQSCGGVVYDGLPHPGTAVRVSTGGEIELSGPTLMRGYRGDAAGTVAAFTADGWLRTGDAGVIGADGRVTVTGRLDDAIISGGEKVWPAQVEEVLRRHPAVGEVAVVGRPDPEWGERVVAVVVPADAAAPPTIDDLRDFASRDLPRYAAPRALEVVSELPRTALGKVRRGLLRAESQPRR